MANLYMEYFEQKAQSAATHSLDYGLGMWMTHVIPPKAYLFSQNIDVQKNKFTYLLSKRKITNRTSWNTLIVLNWP